MSTPLPAEDGATIRIAAALDRRSTEALVLELRRRLKQLGHGDVSITVTPAGDGAGQPSTGPPAGSA